MKYNVLVTKYYDADLVIEAKTEKEALKKAEKLVKQGKVKLNFTEFDFRLDPQDPILK